jgi:hypothetical protein
VDRTLDLVEFHEDRIKHLSGYKPRAAIDEFKTLSIKGPRGLGHTTAAAQLVMKYPKSIILTPNDRMEEHIIRNYQLEKFTHVYAFHKAKTGNLGFGSLDLMIFDPWTMFMQTSRLEEEVRAYMERRINEVKLFVLLG